MLNTMRDKILKYDQPVPRYTSYPTAPHLKEHSEAANDYAEMLRDIPKTEDVSLYIHIPFCAKMCWYCGCNTKITKKYFPIENYLHDLYREIDIVSRTTKQKLTVTQIHFGGGSPGILSAWDFQKLMKKLHTNFNISPTAEIAIEIDPRGVTEARVAAYAKWGVNRISLGVQDFDSKVLKSINREQPFSISFHAVKLFREYGINNINIDLLYGLPHQTTETIKQTIRQALILKPDRISFFGYAHVPWMKKHMRLIEEKTLPQKELRFDLFETGRKQLKKSGFFQIGIDHFAKPDDTLAAAWTNKTLNRNFQGYTTDQSSVLIGLGASSISRFDSGYVQNFSDIPNYRKNLDNNSLPVQKTLTFSEDDKIISEIIKNIMCYMEVDLAAIIKKYALDKCYFQYAMNKLFPFIKDGFVEFDESRLKVAPHGKPLTRLIAASFDPHWESNHAINKHARAI